MPPSNKNPTLLLSHLAALVSQKTNTSPEQLLSNHKLLDELIEKSNLDWKTASQGTGLTHHELYRWYHDTFQRNLYGPVLERDIQIIREEILKAMQSNRILNQDFQQQVKGRLSQNYHRNSFTVAHNNTKRLLNKKNLEEEKVVLETASSGMIDLLASILCGLKKE